MSDRPPRPERVPAEHRLLGLDRRTFKPALFVIAVFVVLTLVVPQVNSAVAYDDPVRSGERLALTNEIVITPPTGWGVEAGHRVLEDGTVDQSGAAVLSGPGASVRVDVGKFDGTPTELLDQTDRVTRATDDPTYRESGDPVTITTTSGETGVGQGYRGVHGDGYEAAFVIDGTGVEVTVYGEAATVVAASSAIQDMIASITTIDDGTAS